MKAVALSRTTLTFVLNLGQDERIEELRDTHRLESVSRSDQIDSLRRQLEETEALLNASLKAQTHMEEENAKRKADMDQLKSEVERAKGQAKDEEEKRVKAISLLKTVRQKLVKAEKEKEDATRELNSFKDRDRGDREKEQTEKANLQREIDAVNAEREKAIIGLRAQFDRDLKVFKERSEQELQALRGQFELEAVTSKVRSLNSYHVIIGVNILCRAFTLKNLLQRTRKYLL
jgi:chromosome segregation ATPase